MKTLYKFHFDCGRQGELTGLFIDEPERLKKLVESKVDIEFGEALGKHSYILGPLDETDYTFITDDPKVIAIVEEFDLQTGVDPVQAYLDACYSQEVESIFGAEKV